MIKQLQRLSPWQKDLLAAVFLALVIWIAFQSTLHFGFLMDWDDGHFISHNSRLGWTWENIKLYCLNPFQDLYTPLPMLSFMADNALFGLNPIAFRLHNLLLHFLTAFVLYHLILELNGQHFLAFAGALLWAIHPQKAESVVWIVERKDLLCGLFSFAAVLFFLQERRKGQFPWKSSLMTILSIGAKPAAFCVPGVLLVLSLLNLRSKEDLKRECRTLLPPFLCGLAMIAWSLYMSSRTMPARMEDNPWVIVHNLFWYPLTAVMPFERNPIYPSVRGIAEHLPMICAAVLLLAVCVTTAVKSGVKTLVLLCTLLIIGGCMVPVLGFLHYTDFHYCDRYNYLVSGAVWCAIALLTGQLMKKNPNLFSFRNVCATVILMGAVYSYLLAGDLPVWKDCIMLSDSVMHRPGRVNIAAFSTAVYSGIRKEDPVFLTETSRILDKNILYLKEIYPEEQLLQGSVFLKGHSFLISGKFPEADAAYRVMEERLRTKCSQLLWDRTANIVYHDLAVLRMLHSDKKSAIAFLNQELEVHRMKQDTGYRYYSALAMKAELEGDIPALKAAWEDLIARVPDDTKSRAYYEQLKRKYNW